MNKALLSRVAAAFVVSFPIGYFVWSLQQKHLSMIQKNSEDYIAYMKHIDSHSLFFEIAALFIQLFLLVLCIEGIAFLIQRKWKNTSKN